MRSLLQERMEKCLLEEDQFYNIWTESFFYRLIVDVRGKDAYEAGHVATAVHWDDTTSSLDQFLEEMEEDHPIVDKVVFYDEYSLNRSEKLHHIAKRSSEGKFTKQVYILKTGLDSVDHSYPFVMSEMPEEEEMSYPSKILDFLFLGDEESSLSQDVLANLGITHVVSVLPLSPDSAKFAPIIKYCQCPIEDFSSRDIRAYFELARVFTDEAKKINGKVLVHCLAGVSRSPTVVISYIMQALKMSLREAFHHVLSRRSVIGPNPGFLQQLIQYEVTLFGKASMTMEDFARLGL